MTKVDSIYNSQLCSLLFNNLLETYLSIYSLKESELFLLGSVAEILNVWIECNPVSGKRKWPLQDLLKIAGEKTVASIFSKLCCLQFYQIW